MLPLFLLACSLDLNGDLVWLDDSYTDQDQLFGGADAIAGAYALGARFDVAVHPNDHPAAEWHGWTVESTDPAVLLVHGVRRDGGGDGEPADSLQVDVEAVGVGAAELRVRAADGTEVRRALMVVLAPTAVTLTSKMEVISGEVAPDADGRPEVLAGGESLFFVRYVSGDVALAGEGLLRVVDDGGAAVEVVSASDGGEWLSVRPTAAGALPLVLGTPSGDLPVVDLVAVASTDVARLQVESIPDDAEPGDRTRVVALPFTADGSVVHGTLPSWTFDGAAVAGAGEVLEFTVDPARCGPVVAALGGATGEGSLCGRDLEARSVNDLACASAGPGAGMVGVVAALALVARRRR